MATSTGNESASMAVTQSNASLADADERTVELAACGIDTIPDGATVTVTERGDDEYREILIERNHIWIVEVDLWGAELTGVFDDDAAVEKPDRVPQWLEAVCRLECDVDEVTL